MDQELAYHVSTDINCQRVNANKPTLYARVHTETEHVPHATLDTSYTRITVLHFQNWPTLFFTTLNAALKNSNNLSRKEDSEFRLNFF